MKEKEPLSIIINNNISFKKLDDIAKILNQIANSSHQLGLSYTLAYHAYSTIKELENNYQDVHSQQLLKSQLLNVILNAKLTHDTDLKLVKKLEMLWISSDSAFDNLIQNIKETPLITKEELEQKVKAEQQRKAKEEALKQEDNLPINEVIDYVKNYPTAWHDFLSLDKDNIVSVGESLDDFDWALVTGKELIEDYEINSHKLDDEGQQLDMNKIYLYYLLRKPICCGNTVYKCLLTVQACPAFVGSYYAIKLNFDKYKHDFKTDKHFVG